MTRAQTTSTLLALALAGCKPGPLDSDTAAMDDATAPDVGGVIGDPWNCGDDGQFCVGPLQIGSCIDGKCTGRLTDCYVAGESCTSICEDLGKMCEASCEDSVAFGWTATDPDEAIANCSLTIEDTQTPLDVTCDQQLPFAEYPAISCCCSHD